MNASEYQRNFSSGHARNGQPVRVPDDVERLDDHLPCFKCGVRAGVPCRHKSIAA